MAFLHGVETIEVTEGSQPIQLVRTSVIGLVGIAPKGATNELTVISSQRQAVETFGKELPGFTIPQALKAALDQGASRVIVINTFDDATMTTAVVDESLTITGGKATLSAAPVNTPVVTNAGGTTTFVAGLDYEIDAFGKLNVLNFTNIPEGSTILVDFSKLNIAAVTDASLIGGITAGVRTGFELFKESISLFGYSPKILICPTFCENAAVAAQMIVSADYLRAINIIDAPQGTAVSVAIAGRGPSGTLAGFQTSNKRTFLWYSYVKAYDEATDAQQLRPGSQYVAGIISANENYWESPSNTEIKSITGVEKVLTAAINDANSEVNQLNEVGVSSIFTAFGTGFRTWGNRNASFPSNSQADSFLPVQRVKDILSESLEMAMLPFIDRPINQALIDTIRESCNSFIRSLIGRGALIEGSKCLYIPADNSAVDIAAGKLTFEIQFATSTPAERITFKSFLDVSLLGQFS